MSDGQVIILVLIIMIIISVIVFYIDEKITQHTIRKMKTKTRNNLKEIENEEELKFKKELRRK